MMKISSKFIVIEHRARVRGLHWDLRFRQPKGKGWLSFSSMKRYPIDNEKITIVKTTLHSEKDALFTGTIEKGYGAGKLRKIDGGSCIIEKYKTKRHIVIVFKGSKLKGRYHFINTGVMDRDRKSVKYMFFKAKDQEGI